MVGVRKAGVIYDKILYRMKETRRNMMSDALLSLYRKKGPESEEARQMGLKLWDFESERKEDGNHF